MRFIEILQIIYIVVGFAICIYSYFYLYCIYQIRKYHSLGFISTEIKNKLIDDSKLRTFHQLKDWHKKVSEVIADAKKKMQA